MAKASDIVAMARSQLNTKENPSGSNNVKYNTEYYGKAVSGSAYSWCMVFVWWVFKHANASKLFYNGNKIASCTSFCTWAQKNMTNVDKSKGQAGDIVIFKFNKNTTHNDDHVGIIISKNTDGAYQTIEGNTSVTSDDNGGCVMERTRSQSVICHIFRPSYDIVTPSVATNTSATTYTYKQFVKDVQKTLGATADGVAGNETLSKTITISAKTNNKHAIVKVLQKYLNAIGYDCGTVDGVAGVKFTSAVKKFQKANGCTVDGIITAKDKTWKKLLKLV